MERASRCSSSDEPDEDLRCWPPSSGASTSSAGTSTRRARAIELALDVAEALWLPERSPRRSNTQAWSSPAPAAGRRARAAQAGAGDRSRARPDAAVRAYNNLGDMLDRRDRYEEAVGSRTAGCAGAGRSATAVERVAAARRVGCMLVAGSAGGTRRVRRSSRVPEEWLESGRRTLCRSPGRRRGDADEARRLTDAASTIGRTEDRRRSRTGRLPCRPRRCRDAEGEHERGARGWRRTLDRRAMRLTSRTSKVVCEEALEAALALGDDERVPRSSRRRIERLPPGCGRRPSDAHALRFRARLPATTDERLPRRRGGVPRLRHAVLARLTLNSTTATGCSARARPRPTRLLAEAREIFERLRATPWLERVDAAPVRRGSEAEGERVGPAASLRSRERSRARSSAWSAAAALALICPSCRARTRPARFCEECGDAFSGVEPRRPRRRSLRRTPARLRPLRRPGRLHDARPSRRDAEDVARAPLGLLRPLPAADRALRRHRREVHRRRGDGRLGHAGRERRTTPSGPCARRSTWSPPSPSSARPCAPAPAC